MNQLTPAGPLFLGPGLQLWPNVPPFREKEKKVKIKPNPGWMPRPRPLLGSDQKKK
jgi:hypothetical protein